VLIHPDPSRIRRAHRGPSTALGQDGGREE
jgi:hypothetical protein